MANGPPGDEAVPPVQVGEVGRWQPLPEIDLRQLLALSDDTGIFQHARWAVPDPHHGYCIDDNARALIAALLHAQLRGDDERVVPLQRYLAFLVYAFNRETGNFRNFMGYDRRWLEESGSQDSQGRAIWALGKAVQLAPNDHIRGLARGLLLEALSGVEAFTYLRSNAFALLGLDAFLQVDSDPTAERLRRERANWLFDAWRQHAEEDWPWWEDVVTYDNAKLPHALLRCGDALGDPAMTEAALTALRWLLKVQTSPRGHLSIIGNQGWLVRGTEKAPFDQQPLDAYAMVHACLAAAEITGEASWAGHARWCFDWFHGKNDLGVPLYHEQTGGCQDGLNATGPNNNQGAESSLAYLLSVLDLHRHAARQAHRIQVHPPRTLGYALVGAGRFARFCLEQYSQVEGLEPVAVWNRTTSKAEALAEQYHLRAYDDLQEMVQDPAVHLVHVATTPALHAEQALAALRQGKHVLCEKPIATNVIDAQRMAEAAVERDCQLAVNFMMRFGPLAQPVRELIASGLLGAPLRGTFTNRAGDAGLPDDHWFWDADQSGGIFVEHGVHFFDLVRDWLGEATVINGLQMRRPHNGQTGQIDQVACELRYGAQTTVSYYHGFHQPTALDEQDFRLIFERGQLILRGWIASDMELEAVLNEDEIAQLQQRLPEGDVATVQRLQGDAQQSQQRGRSVLVDRHIRLHWRIDAPKQDIYGQALRALMRDLIEAIGNRQHTPRTSAKDGRAALELALEADRLARGVTP